MIFTGCYSFSKFSLGTRGGVARGRVGPNCEWWELDSTCLCSARVSLGSYTRSMLLHATWPKDSWTVVSPYAWYPPTLRCPPGLTSPTWFTSYASASDSYPELSGKLECPVLVTTCVRGVGEERYLRLSSALEWICVESISVVKLSSNPCWRGKTSPPAATLSSKLNPCVEFRLALSPCYRLLSSSGKPYVLGALLSVAPYYKLSMPTRSWVDCKSLEYPVPMILWSCIVSSGFAL